MNNSVCLPLILGTKYFMMVAQFREFTMEQVLFSVSTYFDVKIKFENKKSHYFVILVLKLIKQKFIV
jgi:hypothetical protein